MIPNVNYLVLNGLLLITYQHHPLQLRLNWIDKRGLTWWDLVHGVRPKTRVGLNQ